MARREKLWVLETSEKKMTLLLLLFFNVMLNLPGTQAIYFGQKIGPLSELNHGVKGVVYAVDSRTIHIKDFSYDGAAPDAFFYTGLTGEAPHPDGIIIPDEKGGKEPLKGYHKKDVTLTLPDGLTFKDIPWFAVWCREYAVNFGHVKIPKSLDYPRPQKIDGLPTFNHGVSSDKIVVVDAQTFLIPNFHYDGQAPDAFFWVGTGKPSPAGTRVPDENGSLNPLKLYTGKTIVITLPGDLTVFDIDHLGVWCRAFTVDFGHVVIPKNLNVPPSLKMLGVAPQKKILAISFPPPPPSPPILNGQDLKPFNQPSLPIQHPPSTDPLHSKPFPHEPPFFPQENVPIKNPGGPESFAFPPSLPSHTHGPDEQAPLPPLPPPHIQHQFGFRQQELLQRHRLKLTPKDTGFTPTDSVFTPEDKIPLSDDGDIPPPHLKNQFGFQQQLLLQKHHSKLSQEDGPHKNSFQKLNAHDIQPHHPPHHPQSQHQIRHQIQHTPLQIQHSTLLSHEPQHQSHHLSHQPQLQSHPLSHQSQFQSHPLSRQPQLQSHPISHQPQLQSHHLSHQPQLQSHHLLQHSSQFPQHLSQHSSRHRPHPLTQQTPHLSQQHIPHSLQHVPRQHLQSQHHGIVPQSFGPSSINNQDPSQFQQNQLHFNPNLGFSPNGVANQLPPFIRHITGNPNHLELNQNQFGSNPNQFGLNQNQFALNVFNPNQLQSSSLIPNNQGFGNQHLHAASGRFRGDNSVNQPFPSHSAGSIGHNSPLHFNNVHSNANGPQFAFDSSNKDLNTNIQSNQIQSLVHNPFPQFSGAFRPQFRPISNERPLQFSGQFSGQQAGSNLIPDHFKVRSNNFGPTKRESIAFQADAAGRPETITFRDGNFANALTRVTRHFGPEQGTRTTGLTNAVVPFDNGQSTLKVRLEQPGQVVRFSHPQSPTQNLNSITQLPQTELEQDLGRGIAVRSIVSNPTEETEQFLVPVEDAEEVYDLTKLNCEVLYDDLAFEVRWAVAGDSIVMQLVGKVDNGEYMAFGLSGSDSRSIMIGGDVTVAWLDQVSGRGEAEDYALTAKSQCQGGAGSCPDSKIPGNKNNVRLLNAAFINDFTMLTFQRPLSGGDRSDKSFNVNSPQAVIWAIGPVNSQGDTSYHRLRQQGDILIDFGRSPKWNCPLPDEQVTSKPVNTRRPTPSNKVAPAAAKPVANPWHIPPIPCYEPEDGVFYAQMGPTGGEKGYNAITGHVGWGIAWYINGLLIPEINVVRGKTYTFVVEGGSNSNSPAKYHPFYITDDPEGGYEFKTKAERAKVKVLAGVENNADGSVSPTAFGRLCEWKADTAQPASNFDSFGAYQRTLTLDCQEGQPGILQWTPDKDTPDTVYYQCFTHRFLGWKINVLDSCDGSATGSSGAQSTTQNIARGSRAGRGRGLRGRG